MRIPPIQRTISHAERDTYGAIMLRTVPSLVRPRAALSLSTTRTALRPTSRPIFRGPTTHPWPVSRSFHASSPRKDVFFFAFPAMKSVLLGVTRVSLIALPFVWRWR